MLRLRLRLRQDMIIVALAAVAQLPHVSTSGSDMAHFGSYFSPAHVPRYGDNCEFNCCRPPYDPGASQVSYLKGSGGIEYAIDELDNATLNFGFVFKKRYDPSTFSVHVGCGGCASGPFPHWEEPLASPLDLPDVYHAVKFDPFTQHAHYELFSEGVERRFNTSLLSNCSSRRASVRLVVYDNATEEVVYGVVVGCSGFECHTPTALERIMLPLYALHIHATAWNDKFWTIVLLALVVPVVAAAPIWLWWGGLSIYYVPVRSEKQDTQDTSGRKGTAVFSLRCVFYGLACYALAVDLLETFAHFLVGAQEAPVNGDQGYTTFMVWYTLKIALFFSVVGPWVSAREVPDALWRADSWYKCVPIHTGTATGPCTLFWARGFWSIADMTIAVAALFVGAGFYVYPGAAFVAGALRCYEWLRGRRTPGSEKVPTDTGACVIVCPDIDATTGMPLLAMQS